MHDEIELQCQLILLISISISSFSQRGTIQLLMVRKPKMNENTTASKQTIKSCFHVSLIAFKILSSSSIFANRKISVNEYILTYTKKAKNETNSNKTTWKDADSYKQISFTKNRFCFNLNQYFDKKLLPVTGLRLSFSFLLFLLYEMCLIIWNCLVFSFYFVIGAMLIPHKTVYIMVTINCIKLIPDMIWVYITSSTVPAFDTE